MKGILKFSGIISLMLFVLNFTILGLISPGSAALLLIMGVLIQFISDSLFRIILPIASLLFFLWTLNGGSFSGLGQLLNGMITLIIMMFGVSVMFSGLKKSKSKK